MQTTARGTDAGVTAGRNLAANRAALAARQPMAAACLEGCDPVTSWAWARDGSLSAVDGAGAWVAGCSVPLLAGRALLKTLAAEVGGHCLLSPAQAGLMTAARERLGAEAVLFVVQPDAERCRVMLGCADWSADLAAGRLWVAAGPAWADQLAAALGDHPGLATPGRFVRTRLTSDEETDPLITAAQAVFGRVATSRAAELDRLVRGPAPVEAGRVLVIAGSRFRLWDADAETLLAAVPAGMTVARYDTDDPLTATPLGLAAAARGCAAVLAANVGRADAAEVVPVDVPWITWTTRAGAPAVGGPADALIVPDGGRSTAGWPAGRVRVGVAPMSAPPAAGTGLAVIADVPAVEMPEAVRLFSTQQILWDAIAAELHDDPAVAWDAEAYLTSRAKRMGLEADGVDRAAFVHGLIEPAFTLGIARLLLAGGLPVRLFGSGWNGVPEFHAHAAGAVTDRDAFAAAVVGSPVLVRPTPGRGWHPVDGCGRAVLAADGCSSAELVRRAKRLLGAGATKPASGPTLSSAVAGLLGTTMAGR